MKHSVSFVSMIVPQVGHSFVTALGGPGVVRGGGGGGALDTGTVGALIGGGGTGGAPVGGGGGASFSFLRRLTTRKYRRAPITARRMIPRMLPTTTRSGPEGLIEKAPLCAVAVNPSPSMTVMTIRTSAASMAGAVHVTVVAPVRLPCA